MEPLVERKNYLEQIRRYMGKPPVKVLTGMRRCGKSSLLKLLHRDLRASGVLERNILWVNMESLAFDFISDHAALQRHARERFRGTRGRRYLLLDEVQEIAGWEKAVASIQAEKLADVVVTGSNARLLSSELATRLTGRYVEIRVHPLSFREFLDFRRASGHAEDEEREFDLYLRFGGLPGIHDLPLDEETLSPYLNAVLDSVLLKDVVSRHRVRDVPLLESIFRFAMDNCGNITTAKSIADYFKSQRRRVSTDTVQSYLRYMEDAFLLHKVRRFDLKGRRHLELFEKYYLGDTGLRHGLLGYRGRDIGGLLENVVFLELLRRGWRVSVGASAGQEVDFVAEKADERLYLQVCYLLADEQTVEREFTSLEKIADSHPKLVLSLDPLPRGNRRGIRHLHLRDFLLRG